MAAVPRVVSILMLGTEVVHLGAEAEVFAEITCSQLVDVSPHPQRGFSRAVLDLRQYLWPAPWQMELHADGRPIAETNLQIRPLRVDPCQLTFNFSGHRSGAVGSPQDAVLWTLWHWCWRLCAFDPSDASSADESTCEASAEASCDARDDVSKQQVEVMTLELEGASDEQPQLEMDESYHLTLDVGASSSLRASSIHGFRRGMETLLQVLDALRDPSDTERWQWTPGVSADGKVVSLQIDDHPRFQWRGLMLDTARHFISMQVMKALLLGMASTKFNVLHWHLTDAMSFPLELESLPKLAELGSFGPNKSYSKGMVQHLIAFAANLSIRVVPEIDMPAHTASWIFAEPSAVSNCTHVLPDDPKEAKNVFKARDKLALDISSTRSLQVAKTILQEVAALFPDEFLHVGGDEVDYRCWTTMPHIRRWMQKQGLGPVQALQRFFDEIFTEVKRLGKRPVLWEDSFDQGIQLPAGAVVQPWKCWGSVTLEKYQPKDSAASMLGHASAFLATKLKRSAVQSSCWYLDWPSQWTDFYEHAADEGPLQNQSDRRLLGGEVALWTERMDFTNLLCRAWPRSFAVAERLWSDTKPGLAPQEQRDPQVDQRLELQSERFQRLHRLTMRPLRPGGTPPEALQGSDLKNVELTCPLLESQAIQREEPTGTVLSDSVPLPKEKLLLFAAGRGVLMGLLRHVGPPGQCQANSEPQCEQGLAAKLESWRRDPELCLIWAAFCTSSPLSLADGIALAKTRRSAQEALQLLTGKGGLSSAATGSSTNFFHGYGGEAPVWSPREPTRDVQLSSEDSPLRAAHGAHAPHGLREDDYKATMTQSWETSGFRVIGRLAKSIHGEVHYVQDGQGTPYVAKVVPKDQTNLLKDRDESIWLSEERDVHFEDLRNEIAVLKSLERSGAHPHIINICGAFEDASSLYVITSYCEEGDLFERLAYGDPLGESEKKRYVCDILEGVNHLHRHNIGHRDLSLENVLLRRASCVLIDFGQAVMLKASDGSVNRYFVEAGKKMYRAPEIYVPRRSRIQVVCPADAAPKTATMVSYEKTRCEVLLPSDAVPGKPCSATVCGYAAAAADVFACGICAFLLVVGKVPAAKANWKTRRSPVRCGIARVRRRGCYRWTVERNPLNPRC
eukprot:s161_g18.t1